MSGGTAGGAPTGAGPHLSAEDAAAVLREVLAGARAVRPADGQRALSAVAVGEWTAQAGDTRIVFFVDDASLDHLVSMRRDDGREAGFGDWLARDGATPFELLGEDERLALEQRLREAG